LTLTRVWAECSYQEMYCDRRTV